MAEEDWQHTPAEQPRYAPAPEPPAPPSGAPHGTGAAYPGQSSVSWQRTAAGGDELVDLAYEAAKAKLASQTSAFESLRTRASGVLGVAALMTSFSTGLGLVHADSAKGGLLPSWTAWALLGILLALGCCAFIILVPTKLWLHGPSARIIMDLWESGAAPTDAKVTVVTALVTAQHRNSKALGRRSWAYRGAVLLLLAEALTLVAAIAESSGS
ncbi:hypothetical protein [Streptomyces sp. NRRL S-646]|uniref:hypothetical protein n=1 Tax=Streptomyces sp. NRRL S-646 TaxID=1463917 RepID=UPI0013319BEA|nr:hypothetical protein [Streptomyces sp. NRRL S-646]